MHVARLTMLRDGHIALLDDLERSRAARYHFAADRARFVLGGALLRTVLARALDADAGSIRLDRACERCGEPHGRPRVVDATAHVSVSHSGDVVAVALTAASPVGVDVESIVERPGGDYAELYPSTCTPAEQPFVTSAAAFFTFWTRKEAVLKATGDGLDRPMTDVVVTPPQQAPALVSFTGGAIPPCRMSDVDPGVGYRGAVAVLTEAPVDFAVLDAAPLLAHLNEPE